ncbi:D-beta-hydroxybutyrate dehydrogenase, mitochondrial [Venturia canescens]|uniref:D-beta-hydroxybutyrate dehydrogenase, mitochondrial n=1 Tax=Venturia canescens TaxID=32260 RepID=UPI001C9CE0BF|nr:D-beta-hydroxybutyrate dehydrogenase, mitochondrial [Venturia canescens]XP_043280465.1 D-beta-hydroxybutyrate dehydrogenase, mitochondrial [Venturia canescens]XP_043280467.1 D-beta-hydroxybutyrate dehydrogenase, mitochondrial [Venturia canescens]
MPPSKSNKEETDDSKTWELIERCFLPVAFSHAVAVILGTVLNTLRISQTSSFLLFLIFVFVSVGVTLFYHNLKVTTAGKAVLVTGCESRVGYSLAKRLDELGFTVFAGFNNISTNEENLETLKKNGSGRLHPLQLDITSEREIHSAFLYVNENLPEEAPGLWAIVHSAAWVALGECEWVPQSVLKRTVDINFLSVARVTQVFLPLIRRSKGRIILVSSILARIPSPVRGIQCALGAAIEAWGSCLRLEMRRWGVDVSIVETGEYVTGNAWLKDNAALLNQAREMWIQLDPRTRKEYGQELFQKEMLALEKYTKGPEADLTFVLRALVDGVTKTFPMKRYTPISRQERLQAFVSDHLPKSVYDILYSD